MFRVPVSHSVMSWNQTSERWPVVLTENIVESTPNSISTPYWSIRLSPTLYNLGSWRCLYIKHSKNVKQNSFDPPLAPKLHKVKTKSKIFCLFVRPNLCQLPTLFNRRRLNFLVGFIIFCTFRATALRVQYLTQTCCTMFLLINYYSMFRPQFLAVFRELINLCILYVNFFGTGYYIHIYII
jgi:hypothetical protein